VEERCFLVEERRFLVEERRFSAALAAKIDRAEETA
jgi:hypothetical protein